MNQVKFSVFSDLHLSHGMPAEYYYFDRNGFRFIVLNENYFRYEDEDVAYSTVTCI